MGEAASSVTADSGSSRRRTAGYARYIFFVMFVINLLNYMDRYVFTGASNVIAQELHLSIDQVGYIASAFLIVYTLGTIPFGIWADRASRKNVIAVCITIWSLATVFTAFTNSFFTMFLSRMVLGVGEAGYYPAGTALLSDCYSSRKRAQVMSRWTMGSLIGLMIGFIVGGVVAGLGYGMWRYAFLFTGIPGLLLALLAWRLREPRRNQADEEELALDPHAFVSEGEMVDGPHTPAAPGRNQAGEEAIVEVVPDPHSFVNEVEVVDAPHIPAVPKNVLAQFGTLLRIRTLVVLIVMQIFAFFSTGASVVYLPIYLQQKDTLGLKPSVAAITSGIVVVIGGIVGVMVGAYLADAMQRRYPGARILVCGIGFLLCAPVFALAVTIHSYIIFMICFFVTVVLINIYSGPSTAATQDVVPSALRASAVAVSLLFAHLLGDAFAPTIVGVIARLVDPTHGAHFANNMAGGDLSFALLITCVPTLLIAGFVGLFGARFMRSDLEAALQVDRLARSQQNL
ncbi:MAG: MFS transporter [Ktedonobacteraceae bacterium]|nr:MFS transporter [Ktedonobacteraceae bacterium]